MSHDPMNPHLQSSADPSRSSEEIRQDFLQFFQAKGHEVVPSASLVPDGDGTLLFTNAGMNQFKDVFLGTGQRPYSRAVDTQKCLRVSGKHNDLEEVGHDTYHHTFFEMLGNWSFGDYFKAEAIRWAWELLVERWGLAPDRLYATVHEGDDDFGLSADAEAYDLWLSETPLPEERVLYEPSKENFWMMGDTGPCGPCSELHVDLRPPEARQETPGRELVNVDHPQVMELWNLVFIQYNAQTDGSLEPLDDQHVDTGMGFERMVAVLQGKESTYDTDLFAPLLQAMADRSPREEIRGYDDLHIEDDDEHEQVRIALRVVADHIRAIAFAISDGVMPSNEGRGYVIRRILRRAVRYGYQTLELEEPFLHRLVDPLIEKMGGPFDGLAEQQEFIEQAIRSEEESFLETLGTGIEFFERVVPHVTGFQDTDGEESDRLLGALREDAQAMDLLEKAYVDTDDENDILHSFARTARGGTLPGQIAFLLHDTYGFPIDLTRLMARERDLDVDMEGYETLMDRQQERARAASDFAVDQSDVQAWQSVSPGEASVFVGYDRAVVPDAEVRAVRVVETGDTQQYEVELSRTPFYAEAGGQVGDTGTLRFGDEQVRVLDTQYEGERIAHAVDTLPEDLGGPVEAVVDAERRNHIRAHHTATHLMHAVLRETLGDHVQQKGSLVAPDRLRFDFSHFDAVDEDTLRHIEHRVNTVIQQNIPKQEARDMPIDEALDRGATALFDEQYGDRVRVITFDPDFSMELCGGTHVDATGEIGLFRFLSEGSVASGVRRVEAVAGKAALEHVESELETLTRARRQFRSLHTSLPEAIAEVQEERDRLAGEVDQLRRGQLSDQLDTFIAENAASVDGITVVTGRLDRASMDDLQALGQQFRDKLGEGAVGVLGSVGEDGEKAYVVATVADDLVDDGALRAGDLVGTLGDRLGGGGGGRPSLASAGGRDPEALDTVLDGVPALVRDRLE
ncbi:alanyl-tRNA synthetase [Salinibacter ruber]|uniref:alanine--tRNA ligase n=1 Tax=Salinibacter ruber TaxID=146919 RepID=UPI002169DF05|nr:alanine--tRNA ligase [Salinibacter ruber]MCS3626537.1 alanyl-tRNA synthetase [Salinibacter ruber]MCS4143627.1 alanyl-tRNA synthetase [Salinibacter ruber]